MKCLIKLLAVISLLLLAGCGPKEDGVIIEGYGPPKIIAGEHFNKQPSGLSAIWINTINAKPTSAVYIDGQKLNSPAILPDGKLVTVELPDQIYANPGVSKLYIEDIETGEKSNVVDFVVK